MKQFRIYLTNDLKKDSIRDALPVIEFDPVNGYTFYQTEKYSVGNRTSIRLVLTKENKPIPIKPTDKDYFQNLFNTFTQIPSPYFGGDDNVDSVMLVLFFPQKKDFLGEFICAAENKFYKKNVANSFKLAYWASNNTNLKEGSICYIDSNYCTEWRELINNNFIVTKREALNPDDYGLDTSRIPGLGNTNCVQYYSSFKFGNGYTKLVPGNDIYYINGKEYDFNKQTDKLMPIVIKDNHIMIYYAFLEGILNAQSQGIFSKLDEKKKVLQIQRLYYSNKQKAIQTLKVDFAEGNKQYLDNDKLKTFPIAPYKSNVGLMVPLKEVCDALKAKVIYRPLDGSILIARFFEE